MRFLLQTENEIRAFHDWDDFQEVAGIHWKTIQTKNQNGQTARTKLGKGKIWRAVVFPDHGKKCAQGKCRNKHTNHHSGLCEKHFKEKILQNDNHHFHQQETLAYKGHQTGQLFMVHNDKVYRRAQDANEH